MRIATLALIGAATIGLTACDKSGVDTGTPVAGGQRATAMLLNANGVDVGRATATEVAGGLRFTLDAKTMPPGTHGAHIHTVGRCDAPDFTTAGGHWNPTGAKHGSMNPAGPHEGDLPNLTIGTDGRGTIGLTIPGATMAGRGWRGVRGPCRSRRPDDRSGRQQRRADRLRGVPSGVIPPSVGAISTPVG
jgi:Cu-Zn family superoxide dismutase